MLKDSVLWIIVVVFSFFFIPISSAGTTQPEIVFENSSAGITESKLQYIAVSTDKNNTAYAASDKTVFKTINHGKNWKETLSFRSTENTVNIISISPSKSVYVGTEDGLYKSANSGKSWINMIKGKKNGENSILSIAFHPHDGDSIFIGTKSGLFFSNSGGRRWKRDRGFPSEAVVSSIAISRSDPHIIFVSTDKGLYRSKDSGKIWKKLHHTFLPEKNGDLLEEDNTQEMNSQANLPVPEINKILIDSQNPQRVFLATSSGLLISRDGGTTWAPKSTLGLLSHNLRHIAMDPSDRGIIFAATDRGIFRYSTVTQKWDAFYKGLDSVDIYHLTFSAPVSNKNACTLWAATQKGIFRTKRISHRINHIGDETTREKMATIFAYEPSIEEIRRAAIRYAEVHPDKIRGWRKAASKRAWLPDLKLSYGRDYDWQSSTYFYSTTSQKYKDDDITKGHDDTWSVSLTWELGDLIWNSEQTSIDNRSKLMVQLRSDVLIEVTRLYFERRRLQYEMALSPPASKMEKIEKELRLEELTAHIDALTGSYLSKRLSGS